METKVTSAVSHSLVFENKEASRKPSSSTSPTEASRKSSSDTSPTEASKKSSSSTSPTEALNKSSSSTSPTEASRRSSSSTSTTEAVDQLLDNLVGVWKLQKSDNFDNYLKAQGVGCVARALVSFLDFKISIMRRKKGLRLTIHDYVSEFNVGVPQPLLEHPVTKRKDQQVIVTEEGGKLVCRIWDEKTPTSEDLDTNNAHEKSTAIGSESASGCSKIGATTAATTASNAERNEVITLEMVDENERIKQTLEFDKVVAYRWYMRDPNAAATCSSSSAAAKDAGTNAAKDASTDTATDVATDPAAAAAAAEAAAARKTRNPDSGRENAEKKARRSRRTRRESTRREDEEEDEGEEEEGETREDADELRCKKGAEKGNDNANNDTEKRIRRRRGGHQRKLQCLISASLFL